MDEKYIEKTVCDYAREKGCKVWKWSSPGKRGVHDQIFFYGSFSFTIEFKAKGKEATKLQGRTARELAEVGIPSRCIDNIRDGKRFVDLMVFVVDMAKTKIEGYTSCTVDVFSFIPRKHGKIPA